MTASRPWVRRVRFAPFALATAALSAAILGASLTDTLSAFTASINNSANSASSGSVTMQEQSGSVTCSSNDGTSGSVSTNATTCSTINKFGGATALYPGGPASTQSVTIKNTGTSAVTAFTLAPGAAGCSGTGAASSGSATSDQVCQAFQLTVNVVAPTGATSQVYTGSVKAFPTKDLSAYIPSPSSGSTTTFSFSVALPATATIDGSSTAIGNTYQGKTVNLPLTWTFTSGS